MRRPKTCLMPRLGSTFGSTASSIRPCPGWQVALDLPRAGNVPEGFGHLYTHRANLESWVEITQPEGWTTARTDQLVPILEAQPTYEEAAASSS